MKLIFTRLLACLFFCFLFSSKAAQAQWSPYNLGQLNPQWTAMGVQQSTGTPYVLYSGDAVMSEAANKAQVRRLSGTEWVAVGNTGFSMGAVSWTSIVITPAGVPYVSFRDAGNTNKATVMRLNTTTNTWETIFTSAGGASHTNLALHSTGVPVLAFTDASQGSKAVVMRYTGTGTVWEPVGPAEGISTGAATSTSIAFDSNNNLYLAYSEAGTAVVQRFNGTAWEPVGSASLTGIFATNTDIAIGPDNVPYLLFRTGETHLTRAARVFRLEGNTWVNVGQATGFGVVNPSFTTTSSTATTIDYMNIEVGSDNVPYVGMQESNSATTNVSHTRAAVYRFNAATSAWEHLGGSLPSNTINASNEGFALHKATNTAYISARDASGGTSSTRPLYVWQFTSTTTSLAKDKAKATGIQAYPNPSASSFQFTTSGKFNYTVYNNAGQVMERGQGIGAGEFGSALKAGLYFVQVQTEAGNQTLKLLKQ